MAYEIRCGLLPMGVYLGQSTPDHTRAGEKPQNEKENHYEEIG